MTSPHEELAIRVVVALGLWERLGGDREQGVRWQYPKFARIVLKELLVHILAIGSVVWAALSFYWDISDPIENWFQRSGAVIVGITVLLQYIGLIQGPDDNAYRISVRLKKRRLFFHYFKFWGAVLGTLIWAYGDMLVAQFGP